MVFRRRVGVFFLFLGVVSLVMFGASIGAEAPLVLAFFAGTIFLISGLALVLRNRTPPTSERFRAIRTVQQKMGTRGQKEKNKGT
jgi:hypothetical protein